MRRILGHKSKGALSLLLLTATISNGCAGHRSVLPDCAIERPNTEMLEEQIQEAERAEFSKDGPLLPATYEWIKRLDRDIGLFGDPE